LRSSDTNVGNAILLSYHSRWREFTETFSRQIDKRRETDRNLDAFKRGLSVDRFVHSTDNCKRCSIVSEFYFLESIQRKSPGKEIKESV